jgi:hypothetical protein
MSLITGADVATFLGRGAATEFDLLALAIDQWIKVRSGRQFERAQRTEWPINDSLTFTNTIRVHEYPIESIDEVRIDYAGNFVDGSTIAPDLSRFMLTDPMGEGDEIEYRFGFFWPGARRVQIKYTAGWWPYSDTDPQHAARKVPDYVWRMLCNAAAIVDDAGKLEVFPRDNRGGFSFERWGAMRSPNPIESSIFPPELLTLADSLIRW